MEALRRRVAATAADGRFELYKIAAAFEGNESRRQHGLPLPGGLPQLRDALRDISGTRWTDDRNSGRRPLRQSLSVWINCSKMITGGGRTGPELPAPQRFVPTWVPHSQTGAGLPPLTPFAYVRPPPEREWSKQHDRVGERGCGIHGREAGVAHRFTRPYRPQTNGKVERFNLTLKWEWAYARPYDSNDSRTQELGRWLHTYNYHRPHTALGGKPPITRCPPVTNLAA
jgi:hypothetical protein